MSAVIVREVGPAVADPVALGERAVEQDMLGIGLPQDSQQAGRPPGEVVDDGSDVGVGGADDMPNRAICVSGSCRRR